MLVTIVTVIQKPHSNQVLHSCILLPLLGSSTTSPGQECAGKRGLLVRVRKRNAGLLGKCQLDSMDSRVRLQDSKNQTDPGDL
jgi:hypothetical protein